MSRVGKQEIHIPAGTEVLVQDNIVTVKGKLGTLTRTLSALVSVQVADGIVRVTPTKETGEALALWGTFASHIKNMVQGVNEKYVKSLVIEGIGYKAAVQGNKVVLSVGLSHQVELPIPEGVTVEVDKSDIKISGIDKEKVGQFTAVIRSTKKPEPYKGKGIRYASEIIRRKQGKRAGA